MLVAAPQCRDQFKALDKKILEQTGKALKEALKSGRGSKSKGYSGKDSFQPSLKAKARAKKSSIGDAFGPAGKTAFLGLNRGTSRGRTSVPPATGASANF